jgi:Domain of unknown function (DUF4352)
VATDGDYTFAANGVDTNDTISSPNGDKKANGEFAVVHLKVGNTGTAPTDFMGSLQVLKAADGNIYQADPGVLSDQGGGNVTINPGDQIEVTVAYDVPVGTTPNSIEVHGLPGGTGAELPL